MTTAQLKLLAAMLALAAGVTAWVFVLLLLLKVV